MVMISLVHFFGGDNSCISDDHSPKENDYHSFEWHCTHSSQYDGNSHPFASCAKDGDDYPHVGESYDHSQAMR